MYMISNLDGGRGMPQRRVVTEEADGRSRFASDDEPAKLTLIENVLWFDQLWTTSTDAPLGQLPDDTTLFAAPGAMLWRIWSIPADEELQKLSPGDGPAPHDDHGEIRKDGFHKTDTIDYVFVLDGDIVLQLDDGESLLHPGDCVVQRRTNHAWRNRGDKPVRLLTVMMGVA
jgi:mannose-6-phosphate isomerase-like protein (cupin superfamily)